MKRLSVDFRDMCEFCVMFPKAEGLVIKFMLENMSEDTNTVRWLTYQTAFEWIQHEMEVTEECIKSAIEIGERENILISVNNTVMFNPDFVYVSGLKRTTKEALRLMYMNLVHDRMIGKPHFPYSK